MTIFNKTVGWRTKIVFGALIGLFAAFYYLTAPPAKPAEVSRGGEDAPYIEEFDFLDKSYFKALLNYEAEKTERDILQNNPAPEDAERLRSAAVSLGTRETAKQKVLALRRYCHDSRIDEKGCKRLKISKTYELDNYRLTPRPTPLIDPIPRVKAPGV